MKCDWFEMGLRKQQSRNDELILLEQAQKSD